MLISYPIKGTLPLKNFKITWDKLLKSKKDQAELYMIADLVRNDLSKIEKPTRCPKTQCGTRNWNGQRIRKRPNI